MSQKAIEKHQHLSRLRNKKFNLENAIDTMWSEQKRNRNRLIKALNELKEVDAELLREKENEKEI